MKITLSLRNDSIHKRLYKTPELIALAEKICKGEGARGNGELSLLFCDDAFMRNLNRQWRKKDSATDVLSFGQDNPGGADPRLLGDIVISLETVARFCNDDRADMRNEIKLLFCHGLLHLLGHDHASANEEKEMRARQSKYLGVNWEAAWRDREGGHKTRPLPNRERGGGVKRLGRR